MPTNSEKHMQDFLQTHKWPFQMFWLCLMWDLQQTLSSVITPRNWILFTLCSQPLKTKGTWSNSLVYLKLHLFLLCRCFMNAFSLAHTWRKSNTGGCFTVIIFICTLLCISVCWSWHPECTQFTAAPAGARSSNPPGGRDVTGLKVPCARVSPELLSAAGGEHEDRLLWTMAVFIACGWWFHRTSKKVGRFLNMQRRGQARFSMLGFVQALQTACMFYFPILSNQSNISGFLQAQ